MLNSSLLLKISQLCFCRGRRINSLQIQYSRILWFKLFCHESKTTNHIDTMHLSRTYTLVAQVGNPWPYRTPNTWNAHYNDVIMGAIASQITILTSAYSIVQSVADQRKHQRSASLAFVRGIHLGPVNSPHKWPVTRKMFPFHDIIMQFKKCITT